MKEILESLNVAESKKVALQEAFDKAVLAEAIKLAKTKEAEYQDYLDKQISESKEEISEVLNSYLDRVVEEFIKENEFVIESEIKQEQYEAVLEGFNSLLIATGVDIAQIAEASERKSETSIIESTDDKVDALFEEVLELKEKNSELLKTGLIKETAETMTDLQKDKFYKLASLVEFDSSEPVDFINKLDTLAETVTKDMNESTRKEYLTETVTTTNTGAWTSASSHLY